MQQIIDLVGQTITVFTLDGKVIEGKVLKATEKLIGLEVDMNNWIVPNTGIASILVSKKPKAVQVESASADRATTVGTSSDR